ncbi:MAG TPA: carbohydrate ABC transporter permease [Firmicutes bacterium]|nr:carbohydrate ABC transporter permease [Bacillota bacterium]
MKIFKKKIRESSILYQRSKGEKVLFGIVFVLFFLYAASLIFPLLWLLINSLQDRTIYEVNLALGNAFEFPSALHWENYSYAFTQLSYNGANIFMMFFNSIWYTLAYTLGGVLMSAFTGYALAKYRFKLRGFMYGVIIFTMTIPTVGTTGALFNLVYNVLHIYDSPLYVILKHLCGTGLNFLVLYGFFRNVSWSYAEAAFMDGAGHARVFFSIMLPQALPAIVTLSIVSGIAAWNDYMDVLMYLPSFPTIASGMYGVSRTLPRQGYSTVYFAALVISMLPILILFTCFSNVIMKNFAVGGLKG